MAMNADHFWVVDVEGNGARPPEIIDLAMVEIKHLKLTDNRRHWRVRPEQPIDPMVSRIHGLTDADVADAPSILDIADDFLLWVADIPIVGHNVRVDLEILSRSIPEWKPRSAIDTWILAKTLRPGLASYSLKNLGTALGLSPEAARQSGAQHHSAPYDAILAALVFIELLSDQPEPRRAELLRKADILDKPQATLL
jgi:DNA polymerase III subunit epsilon